MVPNSTTRRSVVLASEPSEGSLASSLDALRNEVNELESLQDVPSEVAQEVWESLREEFYEQVEQFPLSLHRSFTLIGEQDREVEACQVELLPTIRSYVKLRQSIYANTSQSSTAHVSRDSDPQSPHGSASLSGTYEHNSSAKQLVPTESNGAAQQRHMDTSPEGRSIMSEHQPINFPRKEEDIDVAMVDSLPRALCDYMASDSPPSSQPMHVESNSSNSPNSRAPDKSSQCASARNHGLRETDATVPKSVPFPPRPKPKTTRELLTRIFFLKGDLMRASEEKVGLATAAYDSVDRHVRALDAAIMEHEAAIALGFRDGTRHAGTAQSEVLNEGVDEDEEEPQLGMIGPSTDSGGRSTLPSRRTGTRNQRDQRKHVTSGRPAPRVHAVPTPARHQMPVDPYEPRYCYCHQVSYGEVTEKMIACDNPDCGREWFHLGCAGLAAPPKGKVKWYCRGCEEALGRNKKRRIR